jgi:hypothetical protein
MNMAPSTLRYHVRKLGEPLRSMTEALTLAYRRGRKLPTTRERHGRWQGGRVKHSQGYMRALAPDHPRADQSGYVLEHILLAEAKLGRPLEDGEEVHHLNGDRADNRLENLQVLSKSDHIRLHNGMHPREMAVASGMSPKERAYWREQQDREDS